MNTDTTHPITSGGGLVQRGRLHDYECSRTTTRLQKAAEILRDLGIEPTYPEHDARCILNPANRNNRVFGFNYHCECGLGQHPEPTWPAWVTGRTFDLAYQLANEVQTQRGAFNRSQVGRAS